MHQRARVPCLDMDALGASVMNEPSSTTVADLKTNLLIKVLLAAENYIDSPDSDRKIALIVACSNARFGLNLSR